MRKQNWATCEASSQSLLISTIRKAGDKDAGQIAGWCRIINEPTATALAYGFDKKKGERLRLY